MWQIIEGENLKIMNYKALVNVFKFEVSSLT